MLNFDTIINAMIKVFCLVVNEDWNQTLYLYVRAGPNVVLVYVYFYSVVIIGNFLLLQLFLAMLINNFTNATEEGLEEAKLEE